MKKFSKMLVISAFAFTALMFSGCIIDDGSGCECVYEDGPTCLNSVDLATGCYDDCNWDSIVDCDAQCYNDGYTGGSCEYDSYDDGYCSCY